MTLFSKAALCTAALIVALPLAAQAEDSYKREGTISGWGLGSYIDERGATTGCSVSKEANDSTAFGLYNSPQHQVTPFMKNNTWRLEVNETYRIAYSFDEGPSHQAIASAISEETISFLPEDMAPFASGLANGGWLHIHAASQTFDLSLAGSRRAIKWMKDCDRRM